MSSMTLTQIEEKPITVTTDDAISNFADSRHGRLATFLRRPKGIRSLPNLLNAPGIVAVGLSDDNDALIS
jgi:hypothetical protein